MKNHPLSDFSHWEKRSSYQQRVQWNRKRNCSSYQTAKTDKSKVAISSLAPIKDKLHTKAKEVNTFLKGKCEESNFNLISHFNIKPYRHTGAIGLHLNNFGDRQPIKFLKIILKKDDIFRNMQWILLYPYYWKDYFWGPT